MKRYILIPILMLIALAGTALATLTGTVLFPPNEYFSFNNASTFNCTFTESFQNKSITSIGLVTDLASPGTMTGSAQVYSSTGLGYNYKFGVTINNTVRGDYNWYCNASSTGTSKLIRVVNITDTVTIVNIGQYPIHRVNLTNFTLNSYLVDTSFYTVDGPNGIVVITLPTGENLTKWNNTFINVSYYLNYSVASTPVQRLYYRSAPVIQIDYPADGAILNADSPDQVNISVRGEASQYFCTIYTNMSGNSSFVWKGNTVTVSASQINKTNVTIPFQFGQTSGEKWGVFCSEQNQAYGDVGSCIYGWATNRSFSRNNVAPTLNQFISFTGAYSNSTAIFHVNVSGNLLSACKIFKDDLLNVTNTTMANGILWRANINGLPDGAHVFSLQCNDTAANVLTVNTSTTTANVTVDTVSPTLLSFFPNITNYNDCTGINVSWNASETSTGILSYNISDGSPFNVSDPQNRTLHSLRLVFGDNEMTRYVINITSCDLAGNCNKTNMSFITPTKLCTGWSEFVYLSDYQNTLQYIQSNASVDYVYKWFNNNQTWAGWSSAGTGDGAYVEYGDVYLMYTSTDKVYSRVTNSTGMLGGNNYQKNLSNILGNGDNFLGLTKAYNFVNFSNLVLNATNGVAAATSKNPFAILYMSGFNNSNKLSVDYRFNYSWNNQTMIGPGTGIESIWVWSTYNLTTNLTASSRRLS